MIRLSILYTCVLVLVFCMRPAQAQTCSCAGVPILGAMQFATPKTDQWFVAGTYEFHDLSKLVSGSSSIPDETGRDRTSQAFVVEASRGLGEKWSFSGLLSAVEHERDIGGERDTVSGIGDALVMLKFSPRKISLYDNTALTFGLGARIPVGEDAATRQGVVLAEDLQPSTGAFGGIVWVRAARALNDSKGAQIYLGATHTYNGQNDREYQFGHSTTVSFGGSYQTQTPWGFGLELLYRHAERDQRNSVDIPNTGGEWLDLTPTVQYHLRETLALKLSAKIPISRNLNDQLQFTSKYALRVSLSYVFGSQ